MDYQANSKASKNPEKKDKKIEKVVTGEVVQKSKPVGRKLKDIFINADFGSVAQYVGYEVLIPAARNMIVDSFTKGIERMMYGESRPRQRHGNGPRFSYNTPVSRPYRDPRTRPPMGVERARSRDDIIVSTREEGELVLERMNDIIDGYDVVSVSDLYEMVGFPSTHTDYKWGWTHIGGASVKQVREGYLLDLPSPEPL